VEAHRISHLYIAAPEAGTRLLLFYCRHYSLMWAKSTIVNRRAAGDQRAIVRDEPGVTRDPHTMSQLSGAMQVFSRTGSN